MNNEAIEIEIEELNKETSVLKDIEDNNLIVKNVDMIIDRLNILIEQINN